MSSSRNTANTTTTAPAKPFCKVCRDAGKPESEYTSHFVKDQPGPNGKVTCPTLLNQACRICNKTGHTSSYCPQYRRREEPRREERYIEREPRDDRRREEPRREERYIEREPRDDRRREEPRREERRDRVGSYDRLREDTERREQEIRQRDDEYYREQDRRSKPWLQAALKKPEQEEQRRREPYAHPHGPRVRLNIEAPALSVYKHAEAPPLPAIDALKVTLNHASTWGDEDVETFVCQPEQMASAFLQNAMMSNLTTSAEYDFIAACDDQSQMPFFCGQ